MLSLLEHFPVQNQPLQFLTECGNTGLTRHALSYPLVGFSTRANSESIMTGRPRLAQIPIHAPSCPLGSNLPFLTQTNKKELGGDRPLLVRLCIWIESSAVYRSLHRRHGPLSCSNSLLYIRPTVGDPREQRHCVSQFNRARLSDSVSTAVSPPELTASIFGQHHLW